MILVANSFKFVFIQCSFFRFYVKEKLQISSVFALEICKFQNMIVQVTKANFEGNKSFFRHMQVGNNTPYPEQNHIT